MQEFDVEQARADYDSGMTLKAVGLKHGVPTTTVFRRLRGTGAPLRQYRRALNREGVAPYDPHTIAKLV